MRFPVTFDLNFYDPLFFLKFGNLLHPSVTANSQKGEELLKFCAINNKQIT